MTWTVSASGHEEPHNEETEKALARRIADALDVEGNTVSTFSFTGNFFSAASFAEAKEGGETDAERR